MIAPRLGTVKVLVAAGMATSALHFADNTFAIQNYPEPGWITPFGVALSWCVAIVVALVALSRKRADTVFFAAAGVWALLLLGGLLHYAFAAPAHMALRSNVTVLFEALSGVALAVALVARLLANRKAAR